MMRQEQVRGGLISSIHVRLLHLPIKIVIVFKLKKSKKKSNGQIRRLYLHDANQVFLKRPPS